MKIKYNIKETNQIINTYKKSIEEINNKIQNIKDNYYKMDENVWSSKEKKELDMMVNDYFDKISNYYDKCKETIEVLSIANKEYENINEELGEMVNK